jgi:hypothetical protein
MLLKVHTKGIFDYLVLQKCVFEPFEVLKLLRFKTPSKGVPFDMVNKNIKISFDSILIQ